MNINRHDTAILKLELEDTIPVSALGHIIYIIDMLYFGHLWLSLAEMHQGEQQFPDSYTPTDEETLYIHRLEIGTPNILELFGLAQPLIKILAYLGGVGGLIATGKGIIGIIDGIFTIREKNLTYKMKKIELDNAIKKKEEEGKVEKKVIEISSIPNVDLAERAEILKDRISPTALKSKSQMSYSIKKNSEYFIPKYCKKPSFILLTYSDDKKDIVDKISEFNLKTDDIISKHKNEIDNIVSEFKKSLGKISNGNKT